MTNYHNNKGFEILVREHHRRALAYALSLVRCEDTAEELAQEAFLVAYQNLEKFDTAMDFGNWLRGIVRMKYLEWARRRREQTLDEEILDVIEMRHRDWDQAVYDGRAETLTALRHCMRRLQDIAQRTVKHFYMEKMSCAVIAVQMRTTEIAVRKRLERARRNLLHCIQRQI